jgi:ATP-dependent DNA ligase
MPATVAADEARSWRPQAFGRRAASKIDDPIVEPLWIGDRAILHAERDRVELLDEEGEPFVPDLVADVIAALAEAIRADSLVLDGYLTVQATRAQEAALLGVEAPSSGEFATQFLIGQRRRPEVADEPLPITPDAPLAFVAVDILAVDDESLLDIPLLERKRILESVLEQSELVRVGAYVRPPIDSWLATWRALGFGSLAFKASNSRYRPGRTNEDWSTAQIPAR